MTRSIGWGHVVWVLGFLCACGAADTAVDTAVDVDETSQALRQRSISFAVKVRETGTANVHATVFTPSARARGATVLAVPGLAETGLVYEPLARAIFRDRTLRRQIGRVVALDLVGRGESTPPSGLPDGKKFGDLTIEDNVSVVIQAIAALRELGYAPKVLLGHSMGGLATVSVQEALLAKESSLSKLGIEHAILLAPVPPHARPWMMGQGADLMPFIKQSDALGSYLELSPLAFVAQAYSTTAGTLASTAPTPEQVSELGYVTIEPLVTVLQLVESPIPLPDGTTVTVPRPSVRQGAFKPENGTELTLLGFSQDILVPPSTLGDLYTYLTGQPEATGYRTVTADDAVHNAFTSNPKLVVKALNE